MKKLISAAEYFVSVAKQQRSNLNESIVGKLELKETDEEFQELFARRQLLKSIELGLSHLQWQLGMTKNAKALDRSGVRKFAVPLQKELAQLAFEVEDTELRSHIVAAREFVKSETSSHGNVGLSIFDTDATKVDMTVIEGDSGVFNWAKPTHAPEYAPTS